MARQRDHAAIYAARKARALEAGYAGYSGRSGARTARAAGRPTAADVSARVDRRQVIPLAGEGKLIRTTPNGRGHRVIEGQIRKAAARDQVVYATATVRMPDGTTKTVNLWGRGGWDAQAAADAMDNVGGLGGLIGAAIAGAYGDDMGEVDPADILEIQLQVGDR